MRYTKGSLGSSRMKLLLILLLVFGCSSIADEIRVDHCDLDSDISEECSEIILECEELNGTYSIIDNDDFENNSSCCCVFN